VKDPALTHILEVGRIVDSRQDRERLLRAAWRRQLDRELRLRRELVESADRERLLTGSPSDAIVWPGMNSRG
jgi:hypothetical protein